MTTRRRPIPAGSLLLALLFCFALPPAAIAATAAPDSAQPLAGLWRAHKVFGPEIRGTLTITRSSGPGATDGPADWRAEIGPYSVAVLERAGDLTFELPGGQGHFEGWVDPERGRIVGHWTQPTTEHSGQPYATPVVAEAAIAEATGADRWRGEVIPFDDEYTFYLSARPRKDGSLGAFIRNPERNLGVFLNVDRLTLEGDRVRLLGQFRRNEGERVLAEGTYHAGEERISIYLPYRGGTYDFHRMAPSEEAAHGFFARGSRPSPYRYRPPAAEADGWRVGTLAEAGIALGPIAALIETEIDPPAEDVHSLEIHGMLIARHGKLVLEEYFHGFHRDKTHDTRSASKSVTSTLAGAVAASDPSFGAASPVHELLDGGERQADLDPRKRAMTVRDLLTMSSGLACDDGDSSSPGNEETMQEQEDEPDWYRYTWRLPMVRQPGERAFYCSATANLLGAVMAEATGQSLPRLLHERLAQPLQIGRYHLFLTPTGDAYMGGGIHWLPRDFAKLGQLLLDGGSWNGRRILSEAWATEAVAPQAEIDGRSYGYLWWLHDLPYKEGTVSAFFAGGNGGQVVLGIPELDLMIAFFAGNYNDSVALRILQELIPQYILPAIDAVTIDSAEID